MSLDDVRRLQERARYGRLDRDDPAAPFDAARETLESDHGAVHRTAHTALVDACRRRPEWIPEAVEVVVGTGVPLSAPALDTLFELARIRPRALVSTIEALGTTVALTDSVEREQRAARLLGVIGTRVPARAQPVVELAAAALGRDDHETFGKRFDAHSELAWATIRVADADPTGLRRTVADRIWTLDGEDRQTDDRTLALADLGGIGWVAPKRVVGLARIESCLTADEPAVRDAAVETAGRIGGQPPVEDLPFGVAGPEVAEPLASRLATDNRWIPPRTVPATRAVGWLVAGVDDSRVQEALIDVLGRVASAAVVETAPEDAIGATGDDELTLDEESADQQAVETRPGAVLDALERSAESRPTVVAEHAGTIAAFLSSRDERERFLAVRTLATIVRNGGRLDAEVASMLVDRAADADEAIRDVAREVIRIEALPIDESTVADVADRIDAGETIGGQEARILALLGTRSDVPADWVRRTLVSALESPDATLRSAALAGLGDLAAECPAQQSAVVDALDQHLQWIADDRRDAVDALVTVGREDPAAVADSVETLLELFDAHGTETGESFGEGLGQLFGDGGTSPLAVDEALDDLAAVVAPALDGLADRITEYARRSDEDGGKYAALALRAVADATPAVSLAHEALLPVVDDEDASVNQRAAIASALAITTDDAETATTCLGVLWELAEVNRADEAIRGLSRVVDARPRRPAAVFGTLLDEYGHQTDDDEFGFDTEFGAALGDSLATFADAHPGYALSLLAASREMTGRARPDVSVLCSLVESVPHATPAVRDHVRSHLEWQGSPEVAEFASALDDAPPALVRELLDPLRDHPDPSVRRAVRETLDDADGDERPENADDEGGDRELATPVSDGESTDGSGTAGDGNPEYPSATASAELSAAEVDDLAATLGRASPERERRALPRLAAIAHNRPDYRPRVVGHLLIRLVASEAPAERDRTADSLASIHDGIDDDDLTSAPAQDDSSKIDTNNIDTLELEDDPESRSRLRETRVLSELLADDSETVRAAAAAATGVRLQSSVTSPPDGSVDDSGLGDDHLVNRLESLVSDPEPVVRERAVRAIGHGVRSGVTVGEEVARTLTDSIDDEAQVALAACRTLGRIAIANPGLPSAVVDDLCKALSSSDDRTRHAAALALERVVRYDPPASERTIRSLCRQVTYGRRARDEAMLALAAVPTEQLLEYDGLPAALAVSLRGPTVEEVDGFRTQTGPLAAKETLATLARRRPGAVARAFDGWEADSDVDESDHEFVLTVLAEVADQDPSLVPDFDVESITDTLWSTGAKYTLDEKFWEPLYAVLARTGRSAFVDLVEENEPPAFDEVPASMIVSFLLTAAPDDRESIADRLWDRSPSIRAAVAEALRTATDADDEAHRRSALASLGTLAGMLSGSPTDRETVTRALDRLDDSVASVRRTAATAVTEFGRNGVVPPDEAVAHLLGVLADPDGETRRAAAVGLATLAGSGVLSVEAIVEMLRDRGAADAPGASRRERLSSLCALRRIGRRRPSVRQSAVVAVADALDSSADSVRRRAVGSLTGIVAVAPAALKPVRAEVRDCTDDSDPAVRALARWCLDTADEAGELSRLSVELSIRGEINESLWSVEEP